ncbi:hypothetical protein [Rhodococcus sp. NPDC058521]|uniref:hypothetical protein n=1 Tax=Rhodococcus sp. NPDC058521 TaxID=3346536 RepID=UPI003668F038
MVVIGLIILIAAVIVGAAGVMTNSGDAHALTNDFSIFGYEATGSTGMLFLWGVVVGAVGMFGLSVLLAGSRRTARRGRAARHDLEHARSDAAPINTDHRDVRPAGPTRGRSWRHPFAHDSGNPSTMSGHA